jgi:DNA/RNA-binding domain of Phe-tRNA-synthetase-like protein
MLDLTIDSAVQNLAVGYVEAHDIHIRSAEAPLRDFCREVAERTLAHGMRGGDARRQAVRQLLRCGGFKPSGRNKPAQEYLLRSVTQDGKLPEIWNVVDLINAVSLDSGLPISLISTTRVGDQLSIRYGEPDESFIFNQAGQRLAVAGLICLCGTSAERPEPLGTPVKDSMSGKVVEEDRHVVACIYAPRDAVDADELQQFTTQLTTGLARWCGASTCEAAVAGHPA